MQKQILFIHGAGKGAYDADYKLAKNLQRELGSAYKVHYPAMPEAEGVSAAQWQQQIEHELAMLPEPFVLVGHSLGASILLKCLSESAVTRPIAGIFLLASPFWGGSGWQYEGYEELALPDGFVARLPQDVPLFLYHSCDDEVVPFAHLALYAEQLPQAIVRELAGRGHQFGDELADVAADIVGLREQ